jgi:transposase
VIDKSPRAKRTRYPKHATTFEVVEAALEVSDAVATRMHGWLDTLHSLRELLRKHRAEDRTVGRIVKEQGLKHSYVTTNDQYRVISGLVAKDPRYAGVHSQVLQNVADRIEHGTKAWLKGERGPLRPQLRKQHRSFTFTQYGSAVKIRQGRLHMSRLGEARLVGLRKLPGRVKSVNLVFKQGRWFAQFTCEVQLQHSARVARNASKAVADLSDTGLDTGLARIATLADGTLYIPSKPLKERLPLLKKAQRKMSRQFEVRKAAFVAERRAFKEAKQAGPLPKYNPAPLSNRLKKQIRVVAILHTKVANVRRDQLRKVARQIEQQYRMVAVEEHSLVFMQKNRRLARTVSDVAPGLFKQLLRNALGTERYVPVPNQRPGIGGNSQTCVCNGKVPKTLKDRVHVCTACGLEEDRDVVSANIAMIIGFGYCDLTANKSKKIRKSNKSSKGAGQALSRCGEGKRPTGKPAVTSAIEIPQVVELSVKRRFSRNQVAIRNTARAQATAEANNTPLLRGAHAPRLSG